MKRRDLPVDSATNTRREGIAPRAAGSLSANRWGSQPRQFCRLAWNGDGSPPNTKSGQASLLRDRPQLDRLYGGFASGQVKADNPAKLYVGQESSPREVAYRALGDAKVNGNPFAVLPPDTLGAGRLRFS